MPASLKRAIGILLVWKLPIMQKPRKLLWGITASGEITLEQAEGNQASSPCFPVR